MSRRLPVILPVLVLAFLAMGQVRNPVPLPKRAHVVRADFTTAPEDWPQFNLDVQHSGSNDDENGITPQNVATLKLLFQSKLPAVADGAPAYWAANSRRRQDHSIFFTTSTGSLIAMNGEGVIRWQKVPPPGPRWTTSSPALDPSRKFVYSYALDGRVHKYDIVTGIEVIDRAWPVRVTRKPEVEKVSAALSIATARDGTSYLYATLSAYPEPGDDGDYQGHVVSIRLDDGHARTFNVLCSERSIVLGYDDCKSRQAGVWGRPGAIYNESDDSIYIVSSNGPYTGNSGGDDWGDSILRLPPDLRVQSGTPIDAYTPAEYERLDKQDLDLGSSAVALLPRPGERDASLAVHAGKDGVIRLIDLRDMSGTGGPGAIGGELQRLDLPQGGFHFAAPAVWTDPEGDTWVYFTNNRGISALELIDEGDGPHLVERWRGPAAGNSSPVVVNGVVFYARNGRIAALDAFTGNELWSDTHLGDIHWQSPIIVNNAVYMSDLSGVVTAWALPKQVIIR
jgi:outer membrane protein assembly factor BamB